MTAAFDPLERVLPLLEHARRSGAGYMARCPAHDDSKASLSISPGKDQPVVFHCHAGCSPEEVLGKLNLTWSDLSRPREDRSEQAEWTPAGPAVAVYDYTDERGTLLYQVLRTAGKEFRQRVPDPTAASGWRWKVAPTVRRVLYRLPQLTAAVAAGQPVWICEGEKDVASLVRIGLVATCNPGGAGKWRPEYAASLLGATVTIVADRDASGRGHARAVAKALTGAAASIRVVEPAEGKDITDHLRAGLAITDVTDLDGPAAAAANNGHLPARKLTLTAASTIPMKAPRWLYDRRIPAGAITLLAGREGIGKSTIAFDLVARTTGGGLEGTRYGRPAGVAVVATEDQWAEVILPRLVAARADLDRVYRVDAIAPDGTLETIVAPADLELLRVAATDHDIALLILDPIMSVISAELDTHKDREVRQALDPLARFAATTGIAILGLIHVNKSAGTDPLNSIMGSRAFTAVTRSVLYCVADPEGTDDDERYLFCHPKSNLGPKQPSIGYTIAETGILLDETTGETIPTSRVRWGAEDRRTAADVMEAPRDRATGELATSILDWMQAPDRVLPIMASNIVAAFPHEKPDTVRKNLNRMAARGMLTKPIYGHFALPRQDVPTKLDSQLDTLAIPSEVSKVSKVSKDQDELDRLDRLDRLDGTGPLSNLESNLPAQEALGPGQHYGPCTACSTPAALEADGLCFTCYKTGRRPT